jgi:hypothetical protein
MQQLHWHEAPIAFLHQRLVACHASKESSIPKLQDLYLFRQHEPGERPPVEAGAAMLALISRKLFPGFALAFYEPLLNAGQGQQPPQRLALVAKDAILLAPTPTVDGWQGFLIAEGTATGGTRIFQWAGQPEQPACCLAVPAPVYGATGAVWAEEAASLAIQPFPDTPDSP